MCDARDDFTKEGTEIKIKGKLSNEYNAKDLRLIATRLKLTPGEKLKHELLKLLSDGLMNRETYKKLDTFSTQSEQPEDQSDAEFLSNKQPGDESDADDLSSKRQPGDIFRVLNILFDDNFL